MSSPPVAGSSPNDAGRWWTYDNPLDMASALAGTAATLEAYDFERRTRNLIFARLATNRDLPNIYGLAMTRSNFRAIDFSEWKAPVFNVCGSSVETLTNSVGRNKPWILFLTDGGDFTARMNGKKRSRFIDGVFHETDTYRLTRQMFQDCTTYGDGFIKASVSLSGNSIQHDVVLGDELLVDPWDTLYFGRWPRSLIHRTFINRVELLDVYGDDPELAEAIEMAPGSYEGPMYVGPVGQGNTAMVAVLEGWKLPSADGRPGRHVMCISNRAVLVDEPFKRTRFPFAKMSCVSAGRGFWNIGLPEILGPFQANINKTQMVIDECHRRLASGRWFIPTGSGVTEDMIANAPGGAIFFTGPQRPEAATIPAVPPELYEHLEQTIQRAYQRVGISALAAQAQKPAGLNSGEALRTFKSSESERYVTLGMNLEDAVLDLAKIDLELSAEVKPRVKAPRAGGIDVIDWSDLKGIDPTECVMKTFPISSLPTTPAGRLQRAAEMYQAGEISKDDYLRLIDYPDTESVIELNTASRDAIDFMLDKIVEDGVFESPEDYMDLGLALQVAQNRYLRERTKGCPEERLELLRRFMAIAKALQPIPAAAPAAPAMNPAQAGAAGLPPVTPPPIGAAPGGPVASAIPMAA